jgi:hypothetical protein
MAANMTFASARVTMMSERIPRRHASSDRRASRVALPDSEDQGEKHKGTNAWTASCRSSIMGDLVTQGAERPSRQLGFHLTGSIVAKDLHQDRVRPHEFLPCPLPPVHPASRHHPGGPVAPRT